MKLHGHVLCLLLAGAPAVAATSEAAPDPGVESQVSREAAEATDQAAAASAKVADQAAKAPRDPYCVRETGTRIRRLDRHGCNGEPGRSYSREDLDRTGATNAAEALRMLDPSMRGN